MKINSIPALTLLLSTAVLMGATSIIVGCGETGHKPGTGGATGAAGAGGAAGIAGAGGAAGIAGIAGAAGGSGPGGAAGGGCDTAASLLTNGSFEAPVVPVGGYVLIAPEQAFEGWKVVGPGSVAPLSTTFVQNGITFQAQDCAQSVDLTGTGSNSTEGISQVFTTVPSASYELSFWVGNVVDTGGTFGITSTVNVVIDGTQRLAAVNADGAGSAALSWKRFTLSFVAATSSTTIEFHNGDPASDNSNFLDHVTLVAQ